VSQPRNILLIQTDQQRRDCIGAYGNQVVRTPHIDRLAAEGILFEDAFTISPICSPARASLLTGLYPVRHGVLRNPESGEAGGQDLRAGVTTFAEPLRRAGYRVSHVGKWHVGRQLRPEQCGFEGVYYPGYGYPDRHPHYLHYLQRLGVEGFRLKDERYSRSADGSRRFLLTAVQEGPEQAAVPFYLAEQVIAAIRRAIAQDQPFFVRMDFWGPHAPYILPERYLNMYDPADLSPWDNFSDDLAGKPPIQRDMRRYWGVDDFTWDDWARLVAACYGYTTLIDDAIGRVVDFLEDAGLMDQTAVFFTSDHGGMLGAHGLFDKGPYLYDEICRVPLIVRLPGAAAGRRVRGIVYNMDLMPTILAAAGLAIPPDLDAVSLMPALLGDDSWRGREGVYMEFHGHQCPYSVRVLRKDGWKYIFNAPATDELYDLTADAGELRNLLDDPGAQAVLRSLREHMLAQLRALKDPIERYFFNTRLR